jgi:hypothetical protein
MHTLQNENSTALQYLYPTSSTNETSSSSFYINSQLYKRLAPKRVLTSTTAAQTRGPLPISPASRELAAALEDAAEAAPVLDAALEALEATAVTLPEPA